MVPRRQRRDRNLHAELDRVALRAAADREREMYGNAGASPTLRLFSELLSLAFSPFFCFSGSPIEAEATAREQGWDVCSFVIHAISK